MDYVVVFGSRSFTDEVKMAEVIDNLYNSGWIEPEVAWISGMARGADITAANLLKRANQTLYEMPADWDRYGRSAGYRRNVDMATSSTKGICFWDGESRGTKHMLNTLGLMGKPVHLVRYSVKYDPQHRVNFFSYD